MLSDSKLPVTFWAEAVNTTCYILNRVLTVKKQNKTCYELLNNRKPNLKFLEPFGCPCTIMITKERLAKFGEKATYGYFLGYSVNLSNKRVFNKFTGKIEECFEIECLRYTSPQAGKGPDWMFDYDVLFKSFNVLLEVVDDIFVMLYRGVNDESNQSIPSTSAPTPVPESPRVSSSVHDDPVEHVASEEHASHIEEEFQESFVEMMNPSNDDVTDDYQNLD